MMDDKGAPVGPGSREPSPAVSALSGFDPSRVSRVVKSGGTTETYFEGGVFTSFSDPGVFRIIDGTNAWFFEWSDRFGALRVGPRGETREQPSWGSRFWLVTALWWKQGKRTEQIGRHLVAVWTEPPPATHYWIRQGRSRVIIRSDEPEGYIADYSKEIYVEVPRDRDAALREREAVEAAGQQPVPKASPEPGSPSS